MLGELDGKLDKERAKAWMMNAEATSVMARRSQASVPRPSPILARRPVSRAVRCDGVCLPQATKLQQTYRQAYAAHREKAQHSIA